VKLLEIVVVVVPRHSDLVMASYHDRITTVICSQWTLDCSVMKVAYKTDGLGSLEVTWHQGLYRQSWAVAAPRGVYLDGAVVIEVAVPKRAPYTRK
jgi:hypothetical protein